MFTHLRNHSHYSLLRGLPKIPVLVEKANEYKMSSLGLTDYSNMYGTIEFYKSCKAKNIKPIIGVEFSIRYNERLFQIVLLASNFIGYKNLMHITSIVNVEDSILPTLTDEILTKHKEGLIVLSGGMWGDISHLLIYNKNEAELRLKFYKDNFGENFYLEINPQTEMDNGKEMRKETIKLARESNTPLLATCNTHYINEKDRSAHKTLYLVHGDNHSLDEYNNKFQKDVFDFQNGEDVKKIFSDTPDAIENTKKIVDSCRLEIPMGSWVFPKIEFKKSYDEDLKDLIYEGLSERKMKLTGEVKERIEYELGVIQDKNFSPYFLVVNDLIRYARENNILTNIRGSVAGSLITYLLQITKCDPLLYKLPFERFLNPERPSAPDIDMDFSDTRRDEMIDYARKKYGIDNVAQIGTFGTMLARGAVKDAARAMKFPYTLGDRISKIIPMPKQGFPVTIDSALSDVKELKEMYDADRETQIIIDMAKRIEGCVRHISVHAAGIVISPTPIWEWSPIQKDPKGGKIITQYDMYTIEDTGLLKFDFLGIRNLTILGDAIKIVKDLYGKEVNIEEIPLDDKKTFEMLSLGQTMGLFQLNGSGMTRFLKELKPTTIFDINAMVALYRPGPLEMIPEYIKRKHDKTLISFVDPRLEPILDQSFGVIVYQDDVMLIAIHLAGYSWLEADKLRKAMGKKIPAEMQAQKEKLLHGFRKNGLPDKKAELLWSLIEPFAAYGFNKAHAASYGRVAYQTAYMKANFPIAYMTAILTNESGDIDKIAEIVSECKRMKINVLPPHVNKSEGGFRIANKQHTGNNRNANTEEIRFGLYTIKNLGVEISDAIINERKLHGEYKSLEDFIRRIKHKNLNKKSLESLAKCGALDGLAERGEVLGNMENILTFHKSVTRDNVLQNNLFGVEENTSFVMKKVVEATQEEKLAWEKELLGLFVSGSPLDKWKEKIEEKGINISKVIDEIKDNKEIALTIIIEKIKITKTKRGEQMALIHIRDYTGVMEVVMFPETYSRYKNLVSQNVPLTLNGKVSTRNGEKTIVVDSLKELR